ncbi:MAG: protein kinase [Actinomycetota bacterium]|nr:serine/threonine protein kinase [Rubrobacter sp.]MDQ3567640.1 protein kinase [Actinomycetota bacterium]
MPHRESMVEGGRMPDAPVGTVLGGRYEIQGKLGSGGMAVVYKAKDTILGRAVALKTLHGHYAGEQIFRQRFKQEARAMASLDHPNVVKVYDICQDGEMPFIVAECVDGDDLGELLARSGKLNEMFTQRVAAQLLQALSYAHHRGVIHRDIKPSNILITRDGAVKVGDFGIARLIEDDEAETGEPGEVIGSARYMSPEQLQGKEATSRSDIYSAGVLLYHCLTGRPPFSGDVKSLARQQLHAVPKPPRRLNKKISPRAEAVILKALAKRPEDRYPSAAAMLAGMENGLPGATSLTEARRPPAARGSRRRRGRLVTASVLALFLLGAGSALAAGLGVVELPARGETERVARGEALGQAVPVKPEPPRAPEAPAPDPTQTATEEPGGQPENVPEEAAPAKTAPDAANDAAEKEVEYAPVPNVNAYFDWWAADTLRNRGFEVEFVRDYKEGYAPRGVTWGTKPVAGSKVPIGSTVTVYATPGNLR